jgi:hypothetical protein
LSIAAASAIVQNEFTTANEPQAFLEAHVRGQLAPFLGAHETQI